MTYHHDEKFRGWSAFFLNSIERSDKVKLVLQHDLSKKSHSAGRVQQVFLDQPELYLASKERRRQEPLASLDYSKDLRRTKVTNALGHTTCYRLDDRYRLSQVDDALGKKCFKWSRGDLLTTTTEDMKGSCLLKRRLEYDECHNVISETLTGNITGESDQESFTTSRRYSDDGLNLLLEEAQGRKKTVFGYNPGTNLLTQRLTYVDGQPVQREFFEYNDQAVQTRAVVDDGSAKEKDDLTDIAVRTITRISPNSLGLPEEIIESYWDGGAEKQLKRTVLTYTKRGEVDRREVYDDCDQFAYEGPCCISPRLRAVAALAA